MNARVLDGDPAATKLSALTMARSASSAMCVTIFGLPAKKAWNPPRICVMRSQKVLPHSPRH